MDPRDDQAPAAPVIVNPQGQPARSATSTACPRCGAGKAKRRLSGGFGILHDICGECGHDFEERTL